MRREEIAAWMYELADWFEGIANHSSMTCTNELNLKRAALWKQRAAQVSAMRCETCKYYEPEADETDDECLHPTMLVSNQGIDFGCFQHEQKPAG